MPVPEGLAGMRVDAGVARLLGLSRTAAAAVAEGGGVEIDGVRAGKSERRHTGAWLRVQLPESPAPGENTPVEVSAGMAPPCSAAWLRRDFGSAPLAFMSARASSNALTPEPRG